SAIDGDGHRKPRWYAIRQAYRDRLLTIQPRDGGLALIAVNDSLDRWRADIPVSRHHFSGATLGHTTLTIDLPPRGVLTHPPPPPPPPPPHPPPPHPPPRPRPRPA